MIEFVCRMCGCDHYDIAGDYFRCSGCGVVFDNIFLFTLPHVKFMKLHKDAECPKRAVDGDVGYGAVSIDTVTIEPMDIVMVQTGISVELPPHTEMQVRARSGMAKKHGIMVVNGPGTIDTGYRGPCNILLLNTKTEPYVITKGDTVAQFLITTKLPYTFVEGESLSTTDRGDGRFGHTGK
ncbi:MAG: dUTP diphosphatase [Candidatus Peribacteraceae bacterium]|nr:dUTP diphosphatase [Candidatus Peribacteraceae bacterium]